MFRKLKPRTAPSHLCSQSTDCTQFPAADDLTPRAINRLEDELSNTLITPPQAYIDGDTSTSSRISPSRTAAHPQAGRSAVADISIPERRPTHLTTSRVAEHELGDAKALGGPLSFFSKLQNVDDNTHAQLSPLPSPSKEKRPDSYVIRSDNGHEKKSQSKTHILADWFHGESAPIRIGVPLLPAKEKLELVDDSLTIEPIMPRQSTLTGGNVQMQFFDTCKPPNNPQERYQAAKAPVTPPTARSAGRFSFFSTKSTSPTPQLSDPSDELANLDVRSALLPGGQGDPFSPSSFKNLLQNAEGLLLRMQAAYKHRTASFRELTAEKEAQEEELDEAQTRAKHLKLQLDDMTAMMVEQDAAMMTLVDELAEQKKLRQDEEAKRSIRMVEESDLSRCRHCLHKKTPEKRRISGTSDISLELSDEDSIFSLTTTSTISSPSLTSPDVFNDLNPSLGGSRRISPSDLAASPWKSEHRNFAQMQLAHPESCPNCAGVKETEAWSVVDMMKMENAVLKKRIVHLEGTLDDCLDLMGGF
ncbi:hypothetical protein MMC13_007379 [Lambiella insularis]|nr:hypothetical protein [Lambiella insularis]